MRKSRLPVARWLVSAALLVAAGSMEVSILRAQASVTDAPAAPAADRRASSDTLENTDGRLLTLSREVTARPTGRGHLALADAYFARGILDAAYRHYNAVTHYDPKDPSAHEGLSRIWRTWGFTVYALASAHRAVFLAPTDPSAHNTLGTALLAAGDLPAAKRAFARAAAYAPTRAYPLVNLCLLALREGDVAGASEQCDLALVREPTDRGARIVKGFVLARRGAFAEAHRLFLATGAPPEAAHRLGQAYLEAGRLDDAARAFQAALIGDASNSEARAYLRQLQATRARENP